MTTPDDRFLIDPKLSKSTQEALKDLQKYSGSFKRFTSIPWIGGRKRGETKSGQCMARKGCDIL